MSSDSNRDSANEPSGLPQEVRRRVLLSWLSLATERLYPVIWPSGGIAGVFIVLALANFFVLLPDWLHMLVLAGFFAAMVWAVMWSLRQSSVPTHAQAVRHLEQSSGLDHRPLSALEDRPASMADQDSRTLWRAHLRWISAHMNRLRVAWPKLSLSSRDPHALRVLLGLVIVVLAVANWEEVPTRLVLALSPGGAQAAAPSTVEAWVTPPAYTRDSPRHLTAATSAGEDQAISVPRGSTLTVRTHGPSFATLRVMSIGGEVPYQARPDFLPAGGDARDARHVINGDMVARLSMNAKQVAAWRFVAAADRSPRISFKSPLGVTQAQSLRIHYALDDDYGVASAKAVVALAANAPGAAGAKPIVVDLPLPPAPARTGDAMIFKDLTDHIWAGLKVTVTLVARDELGQEGRTKPVTIVLPERRFSDRLARALIEQRRLLTRDPRSAGMVDNALEALSIAPERFTPDPRVFLALRTAAFHVHRAQLDATRIDMARIMSAQQLLWDLAMRVEQGDAAMAQADLRDIQRKLMDALARGAPDAEIEQLMAQLRAALERSLRSMAQNQRNADGSAVGSNGQVLRPQDLEQMLDQIAELSRQGSRAAAQQMLSQMMNMLENLQAAGGGKMSPEQQAATEALEKLGSIMARQRGLMDQTYREQRQQAEAGTNKPSPLQGTQEKLGDELSPIIRQGSKSDFASALRRAQDAMDSAADQLGTGKLGDAGQSQQRALEELRKGGEGMVRQLMQQMGAQGTTVPGAPGAAGGEDEDPFGRPMASQGASQGNSVRVPDRLDIQKAREILEELQRRAAERGRPDNELEYIERLLRRF